MLNFFSVAAATQGGNTWAFMVPLIIVFVVMMIISGRSQKKQRQKQQQLMDSLTKGTKVRTIGGFCATVAEVKGDTVMIVLADKMPPVEVVKNAIAVVIEDKPAENKPAEEKPAEEKK